MVRRSRGIRTREWDLLRAQSLRRDGYICQKCGTRPSPSNRLEVHHLDHDALNNDRRNLATYCRGCHIADHRKREVSPEREAWKNLVEMELANA